MSYSGKAHWPTKLEWSIVNDCAALCWPSMRNLWYLVQLVVEQVLDGFRISKIFTQIRLLHNLRQSTFDGRRKSISSWTMNNSRSDVRFIIRLKITLFFCFFFYGSVFEWWWFQYFQSGWRIEWKTNIWQHLWRDDTMHRLYFFRANLIWIQNRKGNSSVCLCVCVSIKRAHSRKAQTNKFKYQTPPYVPPCCFL